MPAILVVPPMAEPVPLADLKAHLRLTDTAEDAVAARLLTAARQHVEQATRRLLVTQTWRVSLDRWPASRRVPLPVAPVRALAEARVTDALGGVAVVPLGKLALDRARVPAVLVVGPGVAQPGREAGGIEIDVECGHGAPADVPAPLREAVLRLAALWFEHRLDPGGVTAPPPLIEALIAPWRVRP